MSDWFGIVYREVVPQSALRTAADGKEEAVKQHQVTARLPRSGQPRPHTPVSTRMAYTESIYDAQRVVCAAEEDGDCECVG